MLLSFSAEGQFVLLLFELVLSGLGLLVLVWIQLRGPRDGLAIALRTLSASFALLTAAFVAAALYCRLAVCTPPWPEPRLWWLQFGSDLLRLLGASALVAGSLLKHGPRRGLPLLGGVLLVLLAAVAAGAPADGLLGVRSIVPATTGRLAEAAVWLVGALLMVGPSRLMAGACLLLAAGRSAALYPLWEPGATEAVWAAEHVATLGALVMLALTVERLSGETSLRFFLRLNLTFIVLATSLIVIIAEIERRQFAEFAALQSQELAEFVRGHMLYYTRRGEAPERVLTHDDVVRKLVAEFGRYPDLRRVQVSLADRTMTLAIDRDGVIDLRLSSTEPMVPPRVSPADFAVAPLLTLPIMLGGRPLGRVALFHSLERINERIGWQMQLVFAVFTLFVAVASAVTGLLVVAADRTIRRQYDELERTHRRLSIAERLASVGAIADGVAHEINNPAGILVARADYLAAVVASEPLYAEIRDDLDTIRRQAQRIAKTVKDLLTFSRPGSLHREPVAVHELLEAALDLVRPMMLEKGLRLERRFMHESPTVCGDANRLEQVFLNLLTNAVQATATGGLITVATLAAPGAGELEVVVRDTGCGIPPEFLERIFDPFFTTKEPGKGTGLGLSIAYGIVRDHGGVIEVASEPGVGTEFRVRLPRSRGYSERAAPSPAGTLEAPAASPPPAGWGDR